VRFLVDESLSRRVAQLMAAAEHDAVHVGDLDLLGAPDIDVMAAGPRCRSNRCLGGHGLR
jgi:predicted nuclease of predicted toxin-antitoxin system